MLWNKEKKNDTAGGADNLLYLTSCLREKKRKCYSIQFSSYNTACSIGGSYRLEYLNNPMWYTSCLYLEIKELSIYIYCLEMDDVPVCCLIVVISILISITCGYSSSSPISVVSFTTVSKYFSAIP